MIPEIKRHYSYLTSVEISETDSSGVVINAMDLTGASAWFVVEEKEFQAVIATPPTLGKFSADLTPVDTATLDRGRRSAWFKVVVGGETNYYGEHYIEVID